jgi:3-deoxy-7-phosphoheptulonate synthase
MILILFPDTRPDNMEYKQLMAQLANFLGISTRIHTEAGVKQTLTEIYLIGNKQVLSAEEVISLLCVDRIVRIFEGNRVFGRHKSTRYCTSAIWSLVDDPQSSSVKIIVPNFNA